MLFALGNDLAARLCQTSGEYVIWQLDVDGWRGTVIAVLRTGRPSADVDLFRAVSGPSTRQFYGTYNENHHRQLGNLHAILDRLKEIIDRLATP